MNLCSRISPLHSLVFDAVGSIYCINQDWTYIYLPKFSTSYSYQISNNFVPKHHRLANNILLIISQIGWSVEVPLRHTHQDHKHIQLNLVWLVPLLPTFWIIGTIKSPHIGAIVFMRGPTILIFHIFILAKKILSNKIRLFYMWIWIF